MREPSSDLLLTPSNPALRRRGRVVAAVSVAVLLTACNLLQTVYNQAPRYVQWRTNVAHHFTDDQYELAQGAIRRWFQWQRAEQMPQVAELLRLAALDVKGPITPALACERREAYLQVAKAAVAEAAPLAGAVMVQLGPRQRQRVAEFFDDTNDEFRDRYIDPDPQKQAQLAVKFMEKWGSLVYGDFTEPQRTQWAREVQALPFNASTILQEFQRFQRGYQQLLKDVPEQKLSPAQAGARLQALVLDGIDPQEPLRKAQMQRWVQAGCGFAASLQNQTTAAQRERASRQLFGWQADVVEIASSR
ncbi:hypothetical protein EYS42_11230 [Aquabacterium lacunae]|uniref:Lipoprotein n=1 Tax=Aquabacterium lacunae TaxID=2528630 RepID=A0A4Q9H2X9_9BURK|nr:DUF6279 family lipoprotein [Aquabacterium lacunae]TBO30258.1 hypothetical protein EYS42_11230 [Aquabacterium lacunae]